MRKIPMVFVRKKKNPFGGAERYFDRLVGELRRRGYMVEVLYLPSPRWLPAWVQALVYNFRACRRKKESLYFSIDRLTCLDIHRAGGGVHKAYLKTRPRSLNPLHPVYLWIEKRTFEKAKQIIAISEMVKREIITHYAIDEKKISVIYNGINIAKPTFETIAKARRELAAAFKIDPSLPILLFVGSGFRRKGADAFLKILARLKYPFHAFVVGKESHIQPYETLAEQLNISKHVTFTGPRKDVERFYAASDIFLFPTRYEPFGNVILEAMNYENAVITTRQCGGGELLDADFIMENADDYSISETIDNLLNDRKMLETIKRQNRKIAENYSIERNVDRTLEVIEKVMKESS